MATSVAKPPRGYSGKALGKLCYVEYGIYGGLERLVGHVCKTCRAMQQLGPWATKKAWLLTPSYPSLFITVCNSFEELVAGRHYATT